jgi:hypothetical protein
MAVMSAEDAGRAPELRGIATKFGLEIPAGLNSKTDISKE